MLLLWQWAWCSSIVCWGAIMFYFLCLICYDTQLSRVLMFVLSYLLLVSQFISFINFSMVILTSVCVGLLLNTVLYSNGLDSLTNKVPNERWGQSGYFGRSFLLHCPFIWWRGEHILGHYRVPHIIDLRHFELRVAYTTFPRNISQWDLKSS